MPEPITRTGLLGRADAGGAPEAIPLTGVTVDAVITGLCARVVVGQRYVNTETRPIEAVYAFPLDEGAAVCGFEAVIGDTLVVGEVKEREEAFRIYDDAMERGDGAFLLDRERADVFQASVGRLPPGGEVLLRITYAAELTVDGNGLRFTIPTTVSPRYAPPADHTGVGRPDAETLNPPVRWDVPYGLNLSVALQMPGRIRQVESPSHPVSIAVDGRNATVRLSARETAPARDFVLAVDADGIAPQVWIDKDADGKTAALAVAFVPTFEDAMSPAEITFLVDRSGSMAGTSIEEVRNALQLCLRSFIPACRFNIVGFGSRTESLFPENRPYDDASLAIAAQHAATARVSTFGIGAGASHHLVKGLARAGGGSAEFIYPGERIEPKVVRLVGRLLSPALTVLKIPFRAIHREAGDDRDMGRAWATALALAWLGRDCPRSRASGSRLRARPSVGSTRSRPPGSAPTGGSRVLTARYGPGQMACSAAASR
jgi:Ca-activated chloride channel family protein